jgi:dihydrofolate synthase / folylpolyglutamate synthase
MNFTQALRYLDGLVNYEKFSDYNYSCAYNLCRIKKLLSLLGSPQKEYPIAVIAGTKGKGSTTSILASILNAASINTGVFLSPHLVSPRERIKIGKRLISEKSFAGIISEIQRTAHKYGINRLTYFEALTAAAFLYFSLHKVNIAVMEIGLGGRLDAVNIAMPSIAAITPISYDHTHLLGRSLRKIAKEKCGVIHNKSFVISARQKREVIKVINNESVKKNARVFFLGKDMLTSNIRVSLNGTSFSLKTRHGFYRNLQTPLIGRHQADNASVAVCLAELIREKLRFNLSEANIRRGLNSAEIAGRFQICSAMPYIILDGAQNEASAKALRDTIVEVFGKKKICLILGVSSDKDYTGIIKNLLPLSHNVICTQAYSSRALNAEELADAVNTEPGKVFACYDIRDSINTAQSITPKNGIILITGSLFLVGEALKVLKEKD